MRKAILTLEILGFISLMTCVLVLTGVASNDPNQQMKTPQLVITGSLG